MRNIDQTIVEEFKISILNTLSRKSVNNCLALLKSIFKKGVEWKMMKVNPADTVSLQKMPDLKYQWWNNKKDISKFLEVAKKDPYYLAYRLALDLGMRLGEIIGLSKDDVSLELGHIHVHRQWLDKEKKYGPTKHGRERFIKFCKKSDLYPILKKALSKNMKSEIIFVTRSGRRLSARKLSGYHFQRLIEISGAPKIRFHDLRHTFASWFMIEMDNIWDLKNILGHSDIQTTQRYAHLSTKHQLAPTFDWSKK